MKDQLSFSWDPSDWEKSFLELEAAGFGTKSEIIHKVNEAQRVFAPVRNAFQSHLKSVKRRFLDNNALWGCEINLGSAQSQIPYILSKFLFVDVKFDPLSLLEMPIEDQIAGPMVVNVFKAALEQLKLVQYVNADLLDEVLVTYKKNEYCYHWTLKNWSLRKQDFRGKLEVSESSERTVVVLTISSKKKELSETFEVYNQPRLHPKHYIFPTPESVANLNLDDTITLGDLRQIELNASGIHMAPTNLTQWSKDMAQFEGNGTKIESKYRITLGAKELSSSLCNALGVRVT